MNVRNSFIRVGTGFDCDVSSYNITDDGYGYHNEDVSEAEEYLVRVV